MSYIKEHLISFAITFLTTFLTTLSYAIAAIPHDQITDGQVFTTSFFVGLILAAVRSAGKTAWERLMPLRYGGRMVLGRKY